jgi:ABC-type iron transport system FetAB ATPase subunit
VLSGGEQQMLTMCRTLMGDPDLVIIDEPTEGRAEADDRAEDIEAALRHGPWPHRLRRHARRARRRCRHPQGMA